MVPSQPGLDLCPSDVVAHAVREQQRWSAKGRQHCGDHWAIGGDRAFNSPDFCAVIRGWESINLPELRGRQIAHTNDRVALAPGHIYHP